MTGEMIVPLTMSGRLSLLEQKSLDPSSLVGSFFLDAELGWQGCVVAEVSPSVYLVETFSWVNGASTRQHLMKLDAMLRWTFYDSAEWMRAAAEALKWARGADEK